MYDKVKPQTQRLLSSLAVSLYSDMDLFVSSSYANFAVDLFKEAHFRDDTLCSPLSVEMVMAMLALGCKEKSNAEILRALGMPDNDVLLSSFANITSALKSVRGAKLDVTNKIYINNKSELKPGIKKNFEEIFETIIEPVDFTATRTINDGLSRWMREQLNPPTTISMWLDRKPSFLLVNTVNFQGDWEKPFDTRLNLWSLFYKSNNVRIENLFMRIPKSLFKYGVSEELEARLLQLKFEGLHASMVIVLPDKTDGLDTVIEKLDSGHDIMAAIETLKNTELEVLMPRFDAQSTSQVHLVTHLIKLGVKTIFDEKRSEINMFTKNDNLYGSNAIHDISSKVDDEKGSPKIDACSIPGSTEESRSDCGVERFMADRPFFYMIIVSGLPIFMGSYKGSQNPSILNYSSNHLHRKFSLTASTLYSRYNDTDQRRRLNIVLQNYMSRVMKDAEDENYVNIRIERRGPNFNPRFRAWPGPREFEIFDPFRRPFI